MRAFLALSLALLLAFALPAAAEDPPQFLLKWGSLGSGNGRFNLPRRLAVSTDGTVYVSDRNNARVQKFTSTGQFLAKWGSLGTGDGQLDFPFGIAVDDAAGYVYVAERNNNRISKFTTDGVFVLKWGEGGGGSGQFNYPIALDVDRNGNVYVGDAFNHRIQKFNGQGVFLTQWGSLGNGDGQFNDPIGLAVFGNNVYVGDAGNNRVQRFTRNGVFLGKWGTLGTGDGQFTSPRGIGVDAQGNVYVADTINSRVQKFTPNGVFVTKWGTFGSGDGQFNRLEDVELDGSGNAYVADASNNRIQKFGQVIVPVTLKTLTAERVGIAVTIRWVVSEVVTDDVSFNVYRTITNGQALREVRERLTGEPLRGERVYTFTDNFAPTGDVDYWVEDVAGDGAAHMHGPVSVSPLGGPGFRLEANYPNPFNPVTTITFAIPREGTASLVAYDVRGHAVKTFVAGTETAGPHTLTWDGLNDEGNRVPSGVYFLRLEFHGQIRSQRVVLLK